MQLDGLNALVTGGSGDIGSTIANALAEAGINVAVSYLGRSDEADEIAKALSGLAAEGSRSSLTSAIPTPSGPASAPRSNNLAGSISSSITRVGTSAFRFRTSRP